MVTFLRGERPHKVLSLRHLNHSAFVLRFTRDDLRFIPGQHVTLGIPGLGERREYSVYNHPADDYLEVLVQTVADGVFTPGLARLQPGDVVMVDGPHGFFTLKPAELVRHHLLIATGTGISPFHSFVKSRPDMVFTLLHGVRDASGCFDRHDYGSGEYIACTSRSSEGDFTGRVTDFLKSYTIPVDSEIMLCGNSQMILDVWDLLLDRSIPPTRMRQEIYF